MKFAVAALFVTISPFAFGAVEAKPTPELMRETAKKSCVGQLMAIVSMVNQSKDLYKRPVIGVKEDREIVKLMGDLKSKMEAIQKSKTPADPAAAQSLSAIYTKGGVILEKPANKELQLCIDANLSLYQQCSHIDEKDPAAQTKAEACAKEAYEKPEIKQKFANFVEASKKRFLITK